MKKALISFLHRGLIASVGGPVVLAIVYLCLDAAGVVHTLSAKRSALEILTASLMAFLAAGA